MPDTNLNGVLFNVYAEMQAQVVDGAQKAFAFVDRITEIKVTRILVLARIEFLELARSFQEGFLLCSRSSA